MEIEPVAFQGKRSHQVLTNKTDAMVSKATMKLDEASWIPGTFLSILTQWIAAWEQSSRQPTPCAS
jgi:hypothetical protein